jgi:hypothetical protein
MEETMRFKYGFTVINEDTKEKVDEGWKEQILHFVGFENPPNQTDWEHIIEELETDPEFSYLRDYNWTMRSSSEKEIEYFQNIMETQEVEYYEHDDSDYAIRIDRTEKDFSKITKH